MAKIQKSKHLEFGLLRFQLLFDIWILEFGIFILRPL